MNIPIITIADLLELKESIIETIKNELSGPLSNRKWLRGKEVQEMLGISNSKLQDLRIKKEITYTSFGNMYYYDIESVINNMDANKVLCKMCK